MSEKKRTKLLEFLNGLTGDGDHETEHGQAEDLLLAYLDDPEITAAWRHAARNWWYA